MHFTFRHWQFHKHHRLLLEIIHLLELLLLLLLRHVPFIGHHRP